MNGMNCAVMAFGASASGKTHTLEGTGPDGEGGVVIPSLHALYDELFAKSKKVAERGNQVRKAHDAYDFSVESWCPPARQEAITGSPPCQPYPAPLTLSARLALRRYVQLHSERCTDLYSADDDVEVEVSEAPEDGWNVRGARVRSAPDAAALVAHFNEGRARRSEGAIAERAATLFTVQVHPPHMERLEWSRPCALVVLTSSYHKPPSAVSTGACENISAHAAATLGVRFQQGLCGKCVRRYLLPPAFRLSVGAAASPSVLTGLFRSLVPQVLQFVPGGLEEDAAAVDEASVLVSHLTFVDCPGAEKLLTDAEVLRLREGPALNRPILALGNVVRALSNPATVELVNYSTSRLTPQLRAFLPLFSLLARDRPRLETPDSRTPLWRRTTLCSRQMMDLSPNQKGPPRDLYVGSLTSPDGSRGRRLEADAAAGGGAGWQHLHAGAWHTATRAVADQQEHNALLGASPRGLLSPTTVRRMSWLRNAVVRFFRAGADAQDPQLPATQPRPCTRAAATRTAATCATGVHARGAQGRAARTATGRRPRAARHEPRPRPPPAGAAALR